MEKLSKVLTNCLTNEIRLKSVNTDVLILLTRYVHKTVVINNDEVFVHKLVYSTMQ